MTAGRVFLPDPSGPEGEAGGFYVSVLHGRSYRLALGPFATHREAKERVEGVRRYVSEHDPRGWFYAYGTARVRDERDRCEGVLNPLLLREAA